MKNTKRKYLNKLFNFALTNNSDDFHVFFDFIAHVKLINIRVHKKGWTRENPEPDCSISIYLSDEEEFETESILKELIELKKHSDL